MPVSTEAFGDYVTVLVAGPCSLTAKYTHNKWVTALWSPFESLMMVVLVNDTS